MGIYFALEIGGSMRPEHPVPLARRHAVLATIVGGLLFCATLMGPAALACPSDDDGDGTCNALDNCPAVANPGQEDYDGDLAGDACDAQEAALNVTRLTLKQDSSISGDNSSVKAKGDFDTAPPGDTMTSAAGMG